MRHYLVDVQLPVRPTGGERFIDLDLAGRISGLARNKLVGNAAIIRDEKREMIRGGFAGERHRRRTAVGGKFAAAAMWVWLIWSGNAFAANCDKHRRIVRLLAERTWFAILVPEIRAVLVDLERERRTIDRGFFAKIFREINCRSSAGNIYNDATLASVLRLHQLHFCAGAAAFCDAPDLFVGRFAKGKNKFFEIDLFLRRIPIRTRNRARRAIR